MYTLIYNKDERIARPVAIKKRYILIVMWTSYELC